MDITLTESSTITVEQGTVYTLNFNTRTPVSISNDTDGSILLAGSESAFDGIGYIKIAQGGAVNNYVQKGTNNMVIYLKAEGSGTVTIAGRGW